MLTERERKEELQKFWEKLTQVRKLSFFAKTKQGTEPFVRIGKGVVKVSKPTQSVLVLEEKGHWLVDHFPDVGFSNIFRWTLDLSKTIISLEHLRYGTNRPVHLLYLTLSSRFRLESIDMHLCGEDTYMGNVVWTNEEICLHWKIIGPKKNDELIYRYTGSDSRIGNCQGGARNFSQAKAGSEVDKLKKFIDAGRPEISRLPDVGKTDS